MTVVDTAMEWMTYLEHDIFRSPKRNSVKSSTYYTGLGQENLAVSEQSEDKFIKNEYRNTYAILLNLNPAYYETFLRDVISMND